MRNWRFGPALAPERRDVPGVGAGPAVIVARHRRRARAALVRDDGGSHHLHVPGASAGQRYWLRLPDGLRPDPASRFQPEGPLGPSELIDNSFAWTDQAWRGIPAPHAHVIYELHIGHLHRGRNMGCRALRLPALVEVGITTIEVMPIAEFAGSFGWGYDGVQLFAPTRLYGRPDAVRRFVDEAHRLGLAVILDVVYNHFGPVGNFSTNSARRCAERRANGATSSTTTVQGRARMDLRRPTIPACSPAGRSRPAWPEVCLAQTIPYAPPRRLPSDTVSRPGGAPVGARPRRLRGGRAGRLARRRPSIREAQLAGGLPGVGRRAPQGPPEPAGPRRLPAPASGGSNCWSATPTRPTCRRWPGWPPPQALEVYEQVLTILHVGHPDRSRAGFTQLFRQGLQRAAAGPGDALFRKHHLPGARPAALERLQGPPGRLARPSAWSTRRERASRSLEVIRGAVRDGLSLRPATISAMVMEFAAGACNALDDHSAFLSPGNLGLVQAALRGKLVGVGVEVGLDDDDHLASPASTPRARPRTPTCSSATASSASPASPTDYLPPDIAAERLRGDAGSAVEVEVERDGPRTTAPSAWSAGRSTCRPSRYRLQPLDDGTPSGLAVGLIRIHHFQDSTLAGGQGGDPRAWQPSEP